LAVTISTRELPQEEARGTVFPLLAKPINRFELIAGKWLGSWSIAAAATMAFYLLVAIVVACKGGRFDLTALAQGFALHASALAILAGIGLLLSCRLNQDAAAALTYIAAAVSALIVPKVPQLAVNASGPAGWALTAVYHLMPHFELFDMRRRLVHDFGPVRWGTFCTVAAYGISLTLLSVLLAWLAYRRKRFTRGDTGM
jgi:ABC-type transport system involved in multi-copper enzyme maturation permease subunit